MLEVLDKVKVMSHIALITVVTASFVIVTNKTYNTLNQFNNVANNFGDVASKVQKALDDENIKETMANTAAITKNIKNLTGNDFEKVKEFMSKFNEQDIESIKKAISNFEIASEDVKEATKILKNKAGLRYYGFFNSAEGNKDAKGKEILPANSDENWFAYIKRLCSFR